MKYTLIPCVVVTALIVSCENPADNTTDATVGEAQTVVTASDQSLTYEFTKTSTIEFVGSKITGSHGGGFKEFSGSFQVENGTPVSGSFSIDMTSTYSDSEKLTGHLTSEDFFNVPQFPESKFEATGFEKLSDTNYKVSGNLTMVGVTNNITFPATVNETPECITLTSEFDIKRKDWGIVYPGKPDDLIRNEVILKFALEATPVK